MKMNLLKECLAATVLVVIPGMVMAASHDAAGHKDGAPSIQAPADKMNVYQVAEKSAQVSSNEQLHAVQAEVGADNAMSGLEQQEENTEIQSLNQEIASANQVHYAEPQPDMRREEPAPLK